MGQQEIYSFLKKYKTKWFSSKELADKLKVSSGSITSCLQRLKKWDLVWFRSNKKSTKFPYKGYAYKFRK